MHYARMNAATRNRSSKYENAPKGIPDVNYTVLRSRGATVTPIEVCALRKVTETYCRRNLNEHAEWPVRSTWEIDPLEGDNAACTTRDACLEAWRTLELTEQYVKLRELTHLLLPA